MPLFPYQSFGAEWLAPKRFAILGDAPRVGKTLQAVWAAEGVSKKAGIVCPASAIDVWMDCIDRWSLGLTAYSIQSYDIATRYGLTPGADTYIFDEAHKLKNPASGRTKACLGRKSPARGADRVWALSGTICQNHVGELFPWLSFAGLTDLTYAKFLDRYCHVIQGPYGAKVMGNKKAHLDELRALFAPYFLRRTRAEVYPSQPKTTWGDIVLRVDNVESGGAPLANDILIPDTFGTEEEDPHLSRLKRLTGEAKAPALARFLANELQEGDEKLVVYGWHGSVLDTLSEGLVHHGVARIDGSTPRGKRGAIVRQFRDDPATRVFVGQIVAAGEAIDLCPANNLVLAEMSWNPKENEQVVARLAGPNQTLPVLIRTTTLKGSLDEATNGVNVRKTRMLSDVFSTEDYS